MKSELCGTLEARKSLLYGTSDIAEEVRWKRYYFHPTQPAGLMAIQPIHGYSTVNIPGMYMLSHVCFVSHDFGFHLKRYLDL